MLLFAGQFVALLDGDFERARDLCHERATELPGWFKVDMTVSAALSEVLLGRPDTALASVAQLDAYDLPFVERRRG